MSRLPPTEDRPRPTLLASFGFARDGILRTLVGERNMKIHWVSGAAVMLVGMALPLPVAARATLLFAVLLVIATEVLNAAVEGLVDLATSAWAYPAKRAKDAAAGVVLVTAIGSVVLLADILVHEWPTVAANGVAVRRTLLFGLPHLAALAVLLGGPRHPLPLLAAAGVAGVAFAPLAAASTDPVFTLMGAGFIAGAGWCRIREPKLLDRRPPA